MTQQEQKSYETLKTAFEKRCEVHQADDILNTLFEYLASHASKLDVIRATADSSKRKQSIKFYIDLGNDIHTTIRTDHEMQKDNMIAWSIKHHDRLIHLDISIPDKCIYCLKTIQDKVNKDYPIEQ